MGLKAFKFHELIQGCNLVYFSPSFHVLGDGLLSGAAAAAGLSQPSGTSVVLRQAEEHSGEKHLIYSSARDTGCWKTWACKYVLHLPGERSVAKICF